MELIYSMKRKPLKCEPPHFESANDPEVIRPLCTISTANIIAFTSSTELLDTDGDTWGGHVYVCDLDTPWEAHKVTSTAYPVSTIEWDQEGNLLLVGTTVGEVSIYAQKEFLLNEWSCVYTANYQGEHIVRASFFHNGRRITAVEKKPDALITERFQMARPAPTLKGLGGVAAEGACVVTASGLIGVLIPPSNADSTQAQIATESLRATRDHVTSASIAHRNGNVAVAAVCRSAPDRYSVRCYICTITSAAAAAPNIAIQPLPTVYLPTTDIAMNTPVSVTWCSRDDTDCLLVAGSALSLWKCSERAHPVHKLLSKGPLQGSTTPNGASKPTSDCFNTLAWQKSGVWPIEGGEACVSASSARSALGAPHAIVATHTTLHLLPKDNHHYLCTRSVVTSVAGATVETAAGSTPPKKTKYGNGTSPTESPSAILTSVDMSYLGGVIVAVDSHSQLHVFKAPQPWADTPASLAAQHATTLMEYCMISGYDCLDILTTLKQNLADSVYERLTENFQRQPQPFQQYYLLNWLRLRIALCKVTPSAQSSVSWLTCLQNIRAAWAAATIALRPDDKPEEKTLASILDDHGHDQDKTLVALEGKTDVLSEAISLLPLRLPLQRCLDIALTTLMSLCQSQPTQNGYELHTDATAVLLLRKLVVLSRMSNRTGEALSRPLARLATSPKPKSDLIDECAGLIAQWTGVRVWESLPRCSVSAPHGKSWPLYFEYGEEPEALKYTPELPAYVQPESTPSVTMDAIRYMYLGGGLRPARWRQCSRCGSRALPAAQPCRHPLQKSYDARFLANCRCGGKWTLFSNI